MPKRASASAPRVIVLGSLNSDLVQRVQRFPQPGETVIGGDLHSYPGGKGAHQAGAAARLGQAVAMIGQGGADALSIPLLARLRNPRASPRFRPESAPPPRAPPLLARGD